MEHDFQVEICHWLPAGDAIIVDENDKKKCAAKQLRYVLNYVNTAPPLSVHEMNQAQPLHGTYLYCLGLAVILLARIYPEIIDGPRAIAFLVNRVTPDKQIPNYDIIFHSCSLRPEEIDIVIRHIHTKMHTAHH